MSQDIMTQADYARYQKDVERGLRGLEHVSSGPLPGCQKCASDYGIELEELNALLEDGTICGEPHFSWSACDCCGGMLGGNREAAHAYNKDDKLVHFTICQDCVYYLEYGELDSTIMARIGGE